MANHSFHCLFKILSSHGEAGSTLRRLLHHLGTANSTMKRMQVRLCDYDLISCAMPLCINKSCISCYILFIQWLYVFWKTVGSHQKWHWFTMLWSKTIWYHLVIYSNDIDIFYVASENLVDVEGAENGMTTVNGPWPVVSHGLWICAPNVHFHILPWYYPSFVMLCRELIHTSTISYHT